MAPTPWVTAVLRQDDDDLIALLPHYKSAKLC